MKWIIKALSEQLKKDGYENIDPRHVAGYMEYGIPSWSNCTDIEWNREYAISLTCIAEIGEEGAELNAVSFGY